MLKSGEMWRFRGMPGAMGREKAAAQPAQGKPREQAELQFTSASGSANRTGKTARTGRIIFHFRQRQRKPHEKKFSRAAWGTRKKCGRNQKEIHSNGCPLPAESNFAKAATQTAQGKPREQAELQFTSANGSANRMRKSGGEQAELHVASANGSTNRMRKSSTSCTGKKKRGRV